MSDKTLIRVGHSPDPDDAFMFHALANDKIDTGHYRFTHELQDIQTLNERAFRGELELTAVSLHDFRGKKIAIPGKLTTAYLALKLALGDDFTPVFYPFDEILAVTRDGKVDAGLIIHEGQLTFQNDGLHLIVDLGKWWMQDTGLPLPLGGNAIRRDLGRKAMEEVTVLLKQSIQYALDHRAEALAYALQFGRDLDRSQADKFVGMYVNDWTLDFGERGRKAVSLLLDRAYQAKIIPHPVQLEFIG